MSLGKKVLVGVGALVGLALLCAVGFVIYVSTQWDKIYEAPGPVSAITASTDPEIIAHGKYLVLGPAHCVECHSADLLKGREVAGEEAPVLSGGFRFVLGPLGSIYAPNLTPETETGIGGFDDALIVRMMRYSIRLNGRAALEPMMPFGNMADDDLRAVLSYLRAQAPAKTHIPDNEWTFMGKMVRTFAPTFQPRTSINPPKKAPLEAVTKERGEYLARYVANCVGCHTPRDPMTFEATGPEFSGGMEMEPFPLPGIDQTEWFRTTNLTPAKDTGLNKFPDRATFVARFKVGGREHKGSAMPWESFALMSETDLGAIYEFLSSIDPVEKPPIEVKFKRELN